MYMDRLIFYGMTRFAIMFWPYERGQGFFAVALSSFNLPTPNSAIAETFPTSLFFFFSV
jgi:hypothetical protein